MLSLLFYWYLNALQMHLYIWTLKLVVFFFWRVNAERNIATRLSTTVFFYKVSPSRHEPQVLSKMVSIPGKFWFSNLSYENPPEIETIFENILACRDGAGSKWVKFMKNCRKFQPKSALLMLSVFWQLLTLKTSFLFACLFYALKLLHDLC